MAVGRGVGRVAVAAAASSRSWLLNNIPGRGYLLREAVTDLDAFVHAIRRVAAGELVIDPAIMRRLMGRLHDPTPSPS